MCHIYCSVAGYRQRGGVLDCGIDCKASIAIGVEVAVTCDSVNRAGTIHAANHIGVSVCDVEVPSGVERKGARPGKRGVGRRPSVPAISRLARAPGKSPNPSVAVYNANTIIPTVRYIEFA